MTFGVGAKCRIQQPPCVTTERHTFVRIRWAIELDGDRWASLERSTSRAHFGIPAMAAAGLAEKLFRGLRRLVLGLPHQ